MNAAMPFSLPSTPTLQPSFFGVPLAGAVGEPAVPAVPDVGAAGAPALPDAGAAWHFKQS